MFSCNTCHVISYITGMTIMTNHVDYISIRARYVAMDLWSKTIPCPRALPSDSDGYRP